MGWMRIAGFVFVLGLVAACDLNAKTPNQCQTDDQCREGAYCDVGRALCVLACEKAGCLEGHFCDPDSHFCKDYCPHACPALPANATLLCGDECVYACNSGSHPCGDQCPLDADATACGASCTACPTDNGAATCNDGVCGYACNGGFYDNAGTCVANEVTHCCGSAGCVDCTASGTVTGMSCGEGGVCAQTERYGRDTSVSGRPTVRDRDTGLIWQGCAAGLAGDQCDGTATSMYWDAADLYCATLNTQSWGGYTGWRLPTQWATTTDGGELSSILLDPCPGTSTCIDIAAFPGTRDSSFWASTYALDQKSAWYVYFGIDYGYAFHLEKSLWTMAVRCVRSGP